MPNPNPFIKKEPARVYIVQRESFCSSGCQCCNLPECSGYMSNEAVFSTMEAAANYINRQVRVMAGYTSKKYKYDIAIMELDR
jgi:hypothetical protein